MKKIKVLSLIAALMLVLTLTFALALTASAAEGSEGAGRVTETEEESTPLDPTIGKAIAAAAVVGLAAAVGAIAMCLAIGKSTESMARQPEAAGKINSAMMLGLVFIETLIIYALIVAILIIFVL